MVVKIADPSKQIHITCLVQVSKVYVGLSERSPITDITV